MTYANAVLAMSDLNLKVFAEIKNCGLETDPQANPECQTTLPTVALDANTVANAMRIFFAIIGFVAVIYIIIAGFQLVTSQGDSQGIAKGRQTIIYAAVGLAVVFTAEAIITLVMGMI